jgi:RNA polymerase sigma-70 factor (ECF subfamily)
MSTVTDPVAIFEAHRSALQGLAYRMLGSVAEAEDMVQTAWLRWQKLDHSTVRDANALLRRIVTRLCLDELKSARRRREQYVGPWLPEPLVEGLAQDVDPIEDVAEDLSVAMMLALERLSPLERAAFLLHDIFEIGFPEVAATLDRSEENCRQLSARARRHMNAARPRYRPKQDESAAIVRAFFTAARSGDVTGLSRLLAEDVKLRSDGGGKRIAASNILAGTERVSRYLAGFGRKALRRGHGLPPVRYTRINGLPGFVTLEMDGLPQTTALEIADGKVHAVYIVRNPEKLSHLPETWIKQR